MAHTDTREELEELEELEDYCALWLCVCCMIAHANAEGCECDRTDGRAHPADLLGAVGEGFLALGMSAPEHECEDPEQCREDYAYSGEGCERITFATMSCDGCSSDLAGERFAATLFV